MRFLFELDTKNYDPQGTTRVRPSVRAIIIRDGKVAMVHSLNRGYYKFPGGGIEKGETHEQTLIRETREEAGLVVIPSSIEEFGQVRKIQKDKIADILIQDNFYYLCDVQDNVVSQALEPAEAAAQLTLEFVDPHEAIRVNRSLKQLPNGISLEREARILELVCEEKCL